MIKFFIYTLKFDALSEKNSKKRMMIKAIEVYDYPQAMVLLLFVWDLLLTWQNGVVSTID